MHRLILPSATTKRTCCGTEAGKGTYPDGIWRTACAGMVSEDPRPVEAEVNLSHRQFVNLLGAERIETGSDRVDPATPELIHFGASRVRQRHHARAGVQRINLDRDKARPPKAVDVLAHRAARDIEDGRQCADPETVGT